MEDYEQRNRGEPISSMAISYLEKLLTDIDEEDKKVLPKWRVRCIDVLNQKIRDTLLAYHVNRFGYDKN